jgi:hypothetical protein
MAYPVLEHLGKGAEADSALINLLRFRSRMRFCSWQGTGECINGLGYASNAAYRRWGIRVG